MRTVKRFLLLIIPMLAATAAIPDLAQLQKMIARFQPTELRVDVSKLSPGDRQALGKLIEAARVLNDIFLTQFWSGNHALYAKLRQDTTPLGKARLDYFWLNKSPWSDFTDKDAIGSNGAGYPGDPGHHSADLKLTERLTRVSADTLNYQATIDDPKLGPSPGPS